MTSPSDFRRVRTQTLVAALVGVCAAVGVAASAPSDVELVSANTAGSGAGNAFSRSSSFSKNGRFLAFFSRASDLVDGDANNRNDVFVRDLATGTTKLVSVNTQRGVGNEDSEYAAISANGRYVAFRSRASDLVPGVATGVMNVYRRDLKTGTTVLVSVNVDDTGGTVTNCQTPVISGNGRYVAFSATASDLLAGVDATNEQVYVRDVKRGVTLLASSTPAGLAGNGTSRFAALSGSGRHVAFESSAGDLVEGDTNRRTDVFVRDLRKGRTTLVSRNRAGTGPADAGSTQPSLSANGRIVAFESEASDLVDVPAGNGDGEPRDVFVRDLRRGVTELVSVNAEGLQSGNGGSGTSSYSLSANGRFVVFSSYADDLPGGASGGGSAYLRDVKKRTTVLVSVRPGESTGVGGVSQDFAVSGNGRMVAFTTDAAGLVPGLADTNNSDDVFVRRMR